MQSRQIITLTWTKTGGDCSACLGNSTTYYTFLTGRVCFVVGEISKNGGETNASLAEKSSPEKFPSVIEHTRSFEFPTHVGNYFYYSDD
jgi:hypothetical protein